MLTTDLLEFHAFCLTNTGTRLDQYAEALARVVKAGDTVVDLGAGLGILSALACRAGAARVHAVESSPIAALGIELTRAAGLGDRVSFTRGSSFELTLPERADVVVADVHAPFGLQEEGLSAMVDARERLLKPGGALVPEGLTLAVAPAEAVDAYARHVDVWRNPVMGLDLAPVRTAAANRPHPARLREEHLLAPMAALAEVDLTRTPVTRLGGHVALRSTRAGLVHGICGAFTSRLAAGITLCNAPGDNATTNFAHAFFPLQSPIQVEAGDGIDLHVDHFDGVEFRWRVATVSARDGQERRAEQSTLYSWPLSNSDLRRERDDYRPALTDRGQLELDLLGRFDGTSSASALRSWLDQRAQNTMSARARTRLLKETIARCG